MDSNKRIKRVLVTGADGYIGGHTGMALKAAGYHVFGLDVRSSPNLWRHDLYHEMIMSDITHLNLDRLDLDGVVHLAGASLVGPSMVNPAGYYLHNVGGTSRLLHWLAYYGFKGTFVFSSSAAVYGSLNKSLISESDTTNPINPYGQSKLMAEKVIEESAKAYGMKAISLRYFNASGADDKSRYGQLPGSTHIIARISEAILNNRPFIVNGNDYDTPDGTCIRDYLHVSDIANAHVLALESANRPYDVYNLGTGKGYSINEILSTFENVTGKTIKVEYGPRRIGDPPKLVADSSRFRADFNWDHSNSSLENIISTSWDWYNSERYQHFIRIGYGSA